MKQKLAVLVAVALFCVAAAAGYLLQPAPVYASGEIVFSSSEYNILETLNALGITPSITATVVNSPLRVAKQAQIDVTVSFTLDEATRTTLGFNPDYYLLESVEVQLQAEDGENTVTLASGTWYRVVCLTCCIGYIQP